MNDSVNNSDHAILELLRDHEQLSVTQLSEALDVTATAVRQRLTRLMLQGLIERFNERHGRGRPQHFYCLTAAGRREVGQNFADLAMVLWQEMCAIEDEALKQRMIESIAHRLASKYARDISGGSLEEKMASIAELFGQRRIPVTVEHDGSLPILNVKACPYPDLVTEDRSICEMEASLFSELIGRDVQLQDGASSHRCNCRFGTAFDSDLTPRHREESEAVVNQTNQ